jgi:hypothetical protein
MYGNELFFAPQLIQSIKCDDGVDK